MNVTSALGWILGSQAPSGAIDVVAIRKSDGTVKCSPFHVKFPVGRSATTDKLVKLKINGKDSKLSMKLGSAGEAFFVERTERNEYKTKREGSSLLLKSSQKEDTTAEERSDGGSEMPSPVLVEPDISVIGNELTRYMLRRIRSESSLPSSQSRSPHLSGTVPPVVEETPSELLLPQDPSATMPSEENTEVLAGGVLSDEVYFRSGRRRSHTIAEGSSYELSTCLIEGEGSQLLDWKDSGTANSREAMSTKRESSKSLTAANLDLLNRLQEKKSSSTTAVSAAGDGRLSVAVDSPAEVSQNALSEPLLEVDSKTEARGALPPVPEFDSVPAIATPVVAGWTWTWGDLPIKSADPSLAELRTLTDIALRERRKKVSREHGHGTYDDSSVVVNESSVASDGKKYCSGTHLSIKSHHEQSWSPRFLECRDSEDDGFTKTSLSEDNSSDRNDLQFSHKAKALEATTDDLSLPDPKHISATGSMAYSKGQSDFRQDEKSPQAGDDLEDKRTVHQPLQRTQSIRHRAAQVAYALGSERIMSLCAHILCSSNAPRTVEDLRTVLYTHQVAPDEFASTPLEVLNNPNLVVVANDVLIPWRLVHEHLLDKSKGQQHDSEGATDTSHVPLTPAKDDATEASVPDSAVTMTVATAEEERRLLMQWAGLQVGAWTSFVENGCSAQGLRTGTPHRDGGEEGLRSSLFHSSSGMGLDTASEGSCGQRARRDSYRSNGSNDEPNDFDLMECFSEVSTSTGLHDMPHNTDIHGDDVTEEMYSSTNGIRMWSKESLGWNSVDDFQRLLNECTRQDSVPDLLKPYITGAYESMWEEDGEGDLDRSTSSAVSGRTRSMLSSEEGNDRKALDARTKVTAATKKSDSLVNSDGIPAVQRKRTVSGSVSHATGLDMMAATSTVPTFRERSRNANNKDSNGRSVNKEITVSSPSCERNDPQTRTSADDAECSEDFLSLHDISHDDIHPGPARGEFDGSDTDSFYSLSLDEGEVGATMAATTGSTKDTGATNATSGVRKYLYRKTLVPSQEQIQAMNLEDGQNEISFQVEGSVVSANIFVWPEDAKVVVADIEGAIFVSGGNSGSSGPLGLMMSLWGSSSARRETHVGLAQLFNSIACNGYRFLYIATKPDASQKDQLLKSKSSADGSDQGLPPGPVFLPPDALIQAFGMDRSDLFKAAALRGVRSLFPNQHNPYHAAFGAQARDVRAFDRCEIPLGRTFLVNERGEITTMSTRNVSRTFTEIISLLHEIFPSVVDKFARRKSTVTSAVKSITEDAYNDFNFWRNPLPPPPPLKK